MLFTLRGGQTSRFLVSTGTCKADAASLGLAVSRRPMGNWWSHNALPKNYREAVLPPPVCTP